MHFVSKLLPTPMKLRWNASIFGCQIKGPIKTVDIHKKHTMFDCFMNALLSTYKLGIPFSHLHPFSSHFLFPILETLTPFRGHQEQQRKKSPKRVGPRSQTSNWYLEPPMQPRSCWQRLVVGTSWIILNLLERVGIGSPIGKRYIYVII